MSEQDLSSKRQRINQACDQCRKRKSKCDGAQPTCSTCDNLGKVCTYGTPVKKRGLPTGYVRGIEALLGLFQQFLPNGEYTLRKILRENIAGRIVDSEYLDNASDIWRSSDLAKDFDQLLSSVDNNIGSRLTSETVQLPELRNVETIIHQWPSDVNLFERLKHCADLPPPDFPPNIQEIVDFYFQTTHSWFPIVERRMILKALYRDDTGNIAERDSDNYSLCLWAIVGYTSAIASAKSARFDAIHPNSIQTYVRFCLTRTENSFSIGSVQALCILALLNIGLGQFNTSRLLLLQAFTMLIDANVEERQNSERYYHTLHGCFFLDQILSAYLSTTSFFPNTWYSVIGHLDENALEEWELSPAAKGLDPSLMNFDRQPLRTISSFNMTCELVSRIPPRDEVSSSIELLAQALDPSHPLYRNPLLIPFAYQLKSSVELSYTLAPLDISPAVRSRFSQFFGNFQEIYNSERSTAYNYHLPAIVSETSNLATTHSARPSTVSPSIMRGQTVVSDDRVYPQTPVSDRNMTTSLPADDTTGERDDLDIIFEDIAAMVLPRRYDEEIADFAQNLGFLSNDLNFDSMAFQGTQGGS
ncbi:C6 transcription factor [Talaromyces pinophilus]|uniref:C6 transcription factor n=1 Tax=Talaromyces pinophilus TaxID=128442 RepID=A0A6V8H1A7_TALPI|nr:C6 transcription factor [Talaromyces pinophilus]